jgi:small multidrug resistance family-3 protein
LKLLQDLNPLVLLMIATVCEVCGDAIIRVALYDHAGPARAGLFVAGAALLFCYGSLLNLGPIEFGRVVGLYIATLFVVWQIVNFVAFRTVPTLPIVVGGVLIVCGGLVITYWKPA